MKMFTTSQAFVMLVLAMICMNSSVSFSQEQSTKADLTSCDCPGIDPIGNESCGPIPAKAQTGIYAMLGCPSAWHTLNKSIDHVHQMTKLMNSKSNLKSPEEVLDYMSCYAKRLYEKSGREDVPPRNLFCHFKTTLAPQIALAAQSAGLPFAVQACLYFRESEFIPDALSSRKASGYIQFMPDTIKAMGNIVSLPKEFFIQKIHQNEALKAAAQEILKGKISKTQQQLNLKNINYYDALITAWKANLAAKEVWEKYWQGTTPAPEISITGESVKCPQIAFALSVMKQTYDLNLLTGNYGERFNSTRTKKQGLSINRIGERDSAILLGGAYNAGVAGLATRCGKVRSLDECIEKFPLIIQKAPNPKGKKFPPIITKIKPETRAYMESIRSCSTKGSDDPMVKTNPKNCGDYRCRR